MCFESVCEQKDFFGSTPAVPKRDLKVFGLMFHAFSIAHLLVERGDCSPLDQLLGSGTL